MSSIENVAFGMNPTCVVCGKKLKSASKHTCKRCEIKYE